MDLSNVWRAALLAVALEALCPSAVRPAHSQPAADAAVIEEAGPLTVVIGGRTYALDTLIVRRPGTDKLPIALITHGTSLGEPRGANLDWLRGWAHDLAHRGWLAVAVMRRGYGKSEGDVAEDAGTCAAPDVGRYLDAHADDLAAALPIIARRPDADMGRVIAIGDSAGGAAVMALAARPSAHVLAVVNVSGGLGRRLGPFQPDPACAPYESDLVWNFARFGATARMPTLWLYAENDSWFRPGLIGRMRAAFSGSGGNAQLVTLPPFQNDGHAMFFTTAGRALLLPEVDSFLRGHAFPTWDPAVFAPLLAKVTPMDRWKVEAYLQQPTEKALAFGPGSDAYWWQGSSKPEEAEAKALAYCQERTKADCTLAAINFKPVEQSAPATKPDH